MSNKKITHDEFKATLAWLAVVGATAVLVALVYLGWRAWLWLAALPAGTLAGWVLALGAGCVVLTMAGFYWGHYFGRQKVEGRLQGIDQTVDRILPTLEKVVNVRDNSRITVHNATKQTPITPATQVYLPDPEDYRNRYTVQQAADGIIDID